MTQEDSWARSTTVADGHVQINSCPHCIAAKIKPFWGGYQTDCLDCCARLVASARPLRRAQEALLAAITRPPTRITREDVLERLRLMTDPPLAIAPSAEPQINPPATPSKGREYV